MGLFVGLGFFEGRDLRVGEDQAVPSHLRPERFRPMLHGLQVVAQPDRADAEGRDRHPQFGRFVGDARLPPGRLDHHRDHRRLDLRGDSVFQDWLAARHLLQRQFATLVVEIS